MAGEDRTQISDARAAIARLVEPPLLDVIIQRDPGRVIPEIGLGGRAIGHSCFTMMVDPDNRNFAASLSGRKIRNIAVHEVHHCMRMAGPGYGVTRGRALVSEGLAAHFTRTALGTPPEPWDRAFGMDALRQYFPSDKELSACSYSHKAWFFGKGGKYPRWLGYTLGYAIVEEWLAKGSFVAARLIDTPAADILSAASPRLQPPDRT